MIPAKTWTANQNGTDKPRKAPKAGSGTSQRRNPLDQELRLAGYRPLFASPWA